MLLYNHLKEHSRLEKRICHSYIKGNCSSLLCRYSHTTFEHVMMMDEENPSINPCSFILESNGCAMNIPKNNRLQSCELDNKRNHFFKPKYVCEQYFYDTSKGYELSSCSNKCNLLHIPWRNFERNMFNSLLDSKKQKCIFFLLTITFNLVCKEESYIFKQILSAHNKVIKVYKEQYLSKCIKCGLPPYKFKLQNPRCFSIFILRKYNLCDDLSKIVSQFIYPKHKKKNYGCYDCLFLKLTDLYDNDLERQFTHTLSCVTFMGLSNISLYGERVVPSYPPYFIAINENNEGRYTESINGPDIDTYDNSTRDKIWKVLIDRI